MEFCPNCESMIIPKKGKLKCRCGYELDSVNNDIKKQYNLEGYTNPEQKIIVTDSISNALPTKKINCYKCGGTEGVWWVMQTRSADEAPTYFIRCIKCGNTWRQSN